VRGPKHESVSLHRVSRDAGTDVTVVNNDLLLPTKDHGCLDGNVYITDSLYLDRRTKQVVSDQSGVLFHLTTVTTPRYESVCQGIVQTEGRRE
jgi:hypothetical protein